MADDDPADVANERFFEAVLGEHPLGRPIGGSPETIEARHPRGRLGALPRQLPAAGPRHHGRRRRRPRRARRRASGARSTRAGWDLAVGGGPGRPPRRRAGATRAGHARSPSSSGPSSRPTCCSACPGLAATDDRRPDAERAQLDLRRRHVVAAVPGGPREARTRLLGLLVRARLLRRRPVRHVRRLLARQGRAGRRAHARRVRAARRATASPPTSCAAPSASSPGRPRSRSRTPTPACRGSAAPSSRSASSPTSTRPCVASRSSPPTTCRRSRRDLVARPFSLAAVGAIDEAALHGAVDEIAPSTVVA